MPSVAFSAYDMYLSRDSTDNSVRQLSDEYSRHRLTDVQEEDAEEEFRHTRHSPNSYSNVGRKRHSSTGSTASSMDALWESNPRRLSEAGLSRHSDSSAVLTEDTDSFIIGERVWVSGTKPGHIAYIGETQFAPGDWAGIALDEAIGKNDGSVGGIRYFQCEPKKGVFSRLSRLTRYPLHQEGMGSGDTYISSPASPVGNGIRRTSVSPTGSSVLMKTSASLCGSNSSLTSAGGHQIDYKLGDRVIVKSSQGSKVGTVRYIGATEFANGEWVGVELDDPRGKNDGSVNGKRYFECRPSFGLFAPVSKVSKSPSKARPTGPCQIHGGLPPSGLRRQGSKESVSTIQSGTTTPARRVRLGVASVLNERKKSPIKTSASTPIPTRTALQDVLKEKQQHIEQLLKERDVERSEIAKVSNLKDEAEQKFVTKALEFDKYREETETKLRECVNMMNTLKQQNVELQSQLEEEKRKSEDLQFRLEETSFTKDEVDVINETHLTKIKELEEALTKEKERTEFLDNEINKKMEFQTALEKAKTQIHNLKAELAESRVQATVLEGDHATTTVLIDSLQKEVDQYKADLSEKTELITILKSESSDLSKKLTSLETLREEEKTTLQKELDSLNQRVQEKMETVEKLSADKLNLETEIDRLKQNLSSKCYDLETMSENVKLKDEEISRLKLELESAKTLHEDLKAVKDTLTKTEQELNSYKDNLEESLKKQTEQMEQISKLQNELTFATKAVAEKTSELEQVKELKSRQMNEVSEKYEEEVKNITSKLHQLQSELDNKTRELEELQILKEKSKDAIETLNKTVEETKAENVELKAKLDASSVEMKEKEKQLETTKENLEAARKDLKSYQLNQSDVEATLTKEKEELRMSLQNENRCKKELNEKLDEVSKTLTEKSEELDKVKTRVVQLQNELEEKNSRIASMEETISELDVTRSQREIAMQTNERLNEEITALQNRNGEVMKQLIQSLQQVEDLTSEKEKLLKDIETKNQLHLDLQELELTKRQLEDAKNEELESKTAELLSTVEKLTKLETTLEELTKAVEDKSREITGLNEKLNVSETEKEKSLKDLTEQYESEFRDMEMKVSDLLTELENKNAEVQQLEAFRSEIEISIMKKDVEIDALKSELAELRDKSASGDENNLKLSENLREVSLKHIETVQKLHEANKKIESLEKELATAQASKVSMEQDLAKVKEEIQVLNIGNHNILEKLNEAHRQIQELIEEKEKLQLALETSNSSSGETHKLLFELQRQLEEENKLAKVHKSEYDGKLETIQKTVIELQSLNKDLEKQKAESETKLRAALESETQLKQIIASSKEDEEKLARLQKELEETKLKQVALNGTVQGDTKAEPNILLEEKLFAENQIEFLNSIIVDMQKKNEEQRARIEILEMGYSSSAADELASLGFKMDQKQPAPRMYCDICEEFDLHETEDCPTQGDDEPVANRLLSDKPKVVPPPRPYCTTCEVFGHPTEECSEADEF